ncbi:uncharacterized protein PAC_10164 [Phialocephala subalpina]|uniref:Enoyl-CoA hydratase/isomerase n=1 Tax=Phialocephala subalpina TaxID=576137 RepID=A0A1L7X5G8_9HELO|nr:uncharacterized protein PAC_10164 [Phialocephala subalpina]
MTATVASVNMHINALAFPLFTAVAMCSTSFIFTTKVTPKYWRTIFSSPPLNIENTNFFLDMYTLIEEITNDVDVKVVVFDSAIQDFWIAHWDVLNTVSTNLISDNGVYWGNTTRLVNFLVLTVAAVRGIASGGRAELAAALDVSFAGDKATFLQAEVALGLVPGGGALAFLPLKVGRNRALEIVISADNFDVKTAAEYGWINPVIPDAQFEYFVEKFARRVAGWDYYGILTAKQLINKNSAFPTVSQWLETWEAFLEGRIKPAFQIRYPELIKAGVQTNVNFREERGNGAS